MAEMAFSESGMAFRTIHPCFGKTYQGQSLAHTLTPARCIYLFLFENKRYCPAALNRALILGFLMLLIERIASLLIVFAGLHFIFGSPLFSQDFPAAERAVLDLADLVEAPEMYKVDGVEPDGNLEAIYFQALPWKGKETRVFAWLGIPENSDGGLLPGVVLVHGGGGTAFKEWVKIWNDHGFAAISIAVEGQTDQRHANSEDSDNPRGWTGHEWAGPRRQGIYADSQEPIEEQWMYHAVADTILANTLLRSLPEVDESKVGITGISWGGVITSTVIGVDDRFAFAIPIYGCGGLADAQNHWGEALGNNELYRMVWDPLVRLHRARMPILWLSWPSDKHFPLDSLASCYQAALGSRMLSLIPGMRHGHAAGWNPPDSYEFAKSVVESGETWCRQLDTSLEGSRFAARFASERKLDNAVLISTRNSVFTGNRQWIETPAKLVKDKNVWLITGEVPRGSTAWFINIRSDSLTVSSEYTEWSAH